jgi:hypothetical protein
MGFSKEKYEKLLKDTVKSSSRNRIEVVAEYAWKYGVENHKELVREFLRFTRKTKPESRLCCLYIMDLLCTYEEARREKERKEKGDEYEKKKKKPNPFRSHFNTKEKLQRVLDDIVEKPRDQDVV